MFKVESTFKGYCEETWVRYWAFIEHLFISHHQFIFVGRAGFRDREYESPIRKSTKVRITTMRDASNNPNLDPNSTLLHYTAAGITSCFI